MKIAAFSAIKCSLFVILALALGRAESTCDSELSNGVQICDDRVIITDGTEILKSEGRVCNSIYTPQSLCQKRANWIGDDNGTLANVYSDTGKANLVVSVKSNGNIEYSNGVVRFADGRVTVPGGHTSECTYDKLRGNCFITKTHSEVHFVEPDGTYKEIKKKNISTKARGGKYKYSRKVYPSAPDKSFSKDDSLSSAETNMFLS